MKTLLPVLLLAGCVSLVSAQEKPQFPHSFGLSAGMVTGYGLTYRYWPAGAGVQLALFPLVQPGYLLVSAGVTGLASIFEAEGSRFFAYYGGNFGYTSGEWIGNEYTVTLGGGVGFEFLLGDHIGFDLQGGLGASLSGSGSMGLNPSIEGGIYYRL
jgi:hypothetical protein